MNVWLSDPQRFDTAFLLQTDTGKVVKSSTFAAGVGITAGVGARCGRAFCAVYVADNALVVQCERIRFVLDPLVKVRYRTSFTGLISSLILSSHNGATIKATQTHVRSWAYSMLDATYDDCDRVEDDFLRFVALLAESDAAREGLRSRLHEDAAPGSRPESGSAAELVRTIALTDTLR